MSFESVPVLDLSHARKTDTKSAFLSALRYALLEVGFLYIKNTGLDDSLIHDVITEGKAFFDLPHEEKLKIQMKNKPSFLGKFPFRVPNSRNHLLMHSQATLYPPPKPLLTVLTNASKLTFPHLIPCPLLVRPFTITSVPPINGLHHRICQPSAQHMRTTSSKCPPSQ